MRIAILRLLLVMLAIGTSSCQKTETLSTGTQNAEVTASVETPSAIATESIAAPAIPVGADVTGAYDPIEEFKGEFAELDFLSLANIDENAAPAPLNGFLRPKVMSAKDYVLENPKIENMRLTFTTAVVEGVHYSFDGAFTVLDDFPNKPPAYEFVVLEGSLTKNREGKSVAVAPVKFRYEAGG